MQLRYVRFKAMGCPCEIRFFHRDDAEADRLADICLTEIRRLETKYSRYLPGSVTNRINDAAGRDPVMVDQETSALLDYAQTCFDQSEGLFDITSGVLRHLWHDGLIDTPPLSEIQKWLAVVGWQKVHRTATSIALPLARMEIDFGGVVKEYAADATLELLSQEGIRDCLVNLGGDIAVLGRLANGQPWEVGITHPELPGQVIACIQVGSGAITTSGGYERFISIGDKKFSHLINPVTGIPADNLQSVTVVAPKAIIAGSICTISMLHKEAEALDFLNGTNLPFLSVDKQGKCHGSLQGE
jgi:thiamine biosynthesis lipoprotein